MKRLLIACTVVIAAFLIFTFTSARHAQVRKSFAMVDTFVQAGSPLQLGTVSHGSDFFLRKAEVTNTSDRTIVSVTFGIFLREAPPSQADATFASSREIPSNIKPNETRTLDILQLTVKEAREKATQLKTNTVLAESGVLAVQFEDGGSWNSDAQQKGRFAPASTTAMLKRGVVVIGHCSARSQSVLQMIEEKPIRRGISFQPSIPWQTRLLVLTTQQGNLFLSSTRWARLRHSRLTAVICRA